MRWLVVILLVLLPASALADGYLLGGATSAYSCTQVGSTQTFTTDPFAGTPTWTAYSEDADCPVNWEADALSVHRSRGAVALACSQTAGSARFDTPIGTRSGCVSVKITALTHGTAGTDAWDGPGLTFWGQAGAVEKFMSVFCEDNTCADVRIEHQGPQAEGPTSVSMTGTFGAVTVGDYMGICFEDPPEPDQIVVRAWHFGNTNPGNPTTWGPEDAQFGRDNPYACLIFDCDDDGVGSMAGVYMRAEVPSVLANLAYDDLSIFSRCDGVGVGESDFYWETGFTWSTDFAWQ